MYRYIHPFSNETINIDEKYNKLPEVRDIINILVFMGNPRY